MTKRKPLFDSDEEYYAHMREKYRGVDEADKKIVQRFAGLVHACSINPISETSFRAYVFYPLDSDIQSAELSGLSDEVKAAVFEELRNVGRGGGNEIDVVFEFDSDQYVQRECNGNYYNRLRG